jgi:uncharacterized protein YcbK (DUF882 family)
MDQPFISTLQTARNLAGIPFRINSGYRCRRHNRAVDGSRNSSHLTGLAADIRVESSRERFLIVSALKAAGFTRIGIGDTFIHADMDGKKTGKLMWLY